MNGVLCNPSASARKRWLLILEKAGHQVYETASVTSLASLIRQKNAEFVIAEDNSLDPEAVDQLVNISPACKIIVLSNQPTDDNGLLYIKAGAAGYANTYIPSKLLTRLVQLTEQGRVWLGKSLMHKLISSGKVSSASDDASELDE